MDREGPAAHGAGVEPAVPAVQRRAALDPRLRVARRRRHPHARQRRGRVHRAAQRGVLRRPRLDLRPGRPAAVPAPAPDPVGRRARRERYARRATSTPSRSRCRSGCSRGTGPPRPTRPRRSRSSACGRRRTAASRVCSTTTDMSWSRGRGRRSRGWATRCSTRSSSRWPQGRVERGAALGRQGVPGVRPAAGAREAAAGPLPGRVPEPGEPARRPGGPGRDPADRHPERAHPRLPELHRVRLRPTCCG